MTTTKETKHLLSKLEHKFPELFRLAEGIMLTGSYASNEHMRSSDIDIVVLSKNINYVHSETTRWASTYVQFVFLPYYKFPNIIMENKGNNPHTSMIRKGIIYKDTTSKLLTKAKRELSKKENVHRCEVIDFALIHQVTSNIDSIKASQSDSEKIYCASELLLNITRLILAKYTGDAKLLSRSISTHDLGSNLIDAYQNLVETKDSSKFTHEVKNILTNYGGTQHTFTTGCVYTYPHDRQIMVFSPSQSGNDIQFQKYLLEIKETFQDYKIYGFYVGKNQSMEEGYYIYIHTIKTAIEELLAKLNSYKSSIVEKALQNGITFSFPYVTLFHEGLQFGGKEIFNDLLPFFTELWTSYLSHTSGIPVEYRKKYSLIFATNYFSMLNSRPDILHCEFYSVPLF